MMNKYVIAGLLSLVVGALAISTPVHGLLGLGAGTRSGLAASDQGAGGGAGIGQWSDAGFLGLGGAFGVGRDDDAASSVRPLSTTPGFGSSSNINGTSFSDGAGVGGPDGERVIVQNSQGVSDDGNHGWLNAGVLADNSGETGGWTGFGLRYDR